MKLHGYGQAFKDIWMKAALTLLTCSQTHPHPHPHPHTIHTPVLRVNSGVWRGFVMRIRINLSSLPLTPTVLFSGVISTLVTHFFFLPSCHQSPFLFTSLCHLLISSSMHCCSQYWTYAHYFPSDINWTSFSNLLSCVWILEYVGSLSLLLFLFSSLSFSRMRTPSLKSNFRGGPLHIVLGMGDLETSILSEKGSN